MTRLRDRRSAQAMVEFALTFLLLMMLMIGVLDLGRGVLTSVALTNAVREGARTGGILYPASGWDTQAANRVRATGAIIDPSVLTLTTVTESSGGSTFVRVSGQYRFRLIAPYITIMRSEILFNSTARMLAG